MTENRDRGSGRPNDEKGVAEGGASGTTGAQSPVPRGAEDAGPDEAAERGEGGEIADGAARQPPKAAPKQSGTTRSDQKTPKSLVSGLPPRAGARPPPLLPSQNFAGLSAQGVAIRKPPPPPPPHHFVTTHPTGGVEESAGRMKMATSRDPTLAPSMGQHLRCPNKARSYGMPIDGAGTAGTQEKPANPAAGIKDKWGDTQGKWGG